MASGRAASREGDRDCLDDETLALLLEGALDDVEAAGVRAHLDTCEDCRRLFAEAGRAVSADSAITGATRVRRTGGNASSDFRPGDLVAGKYLIERALGEGGMGRVLAARHVDLDQLVALKVLQPDLVGEPDVVRRFAREAKAAAALKSEHAARIFDVGRLDDDTPYMVMEYLDGRDLAAVVEQDGPLPIPEAIDFAIQACDAIAEAHDLGIVHRDLKPHNLFLVKGARVKVLDFGLAKAKDTLGAHDNSMTGTNVILGSPFFMSPEQVNATRDVDRRSDIWSMGATIFQLVTGRPPFVAPSVELLCQLIAIGDTPEMGASRPGVPKALEAVVARCLSKDPNARYATARDLERALHGVQDALERGDGELTTAPIPIMTAAEDGDAFDARATVPRDGTATTLVHRVAPPPPPVFPGAVIATPAPSSRKLEPDTLPFVAPTAAPAPSSSARAAETALVSPPPARSALLPVMVVGTFLLAALFFGVAYRVAHPPDGARDPRAPPRDPVTSATAEGASSATPASSTGPDPAASASSSTKRPRLRPWLKGMGSSRTPYDHP